MVETTSRIPNSKNLNPELWESGFIIKHGWKILLEVHHWKISVQIIWGDCSISLYKQR
jgi:hypothetical protein